MVLVVVHVYICVYVSVCVCVCVCVCFHRTHILRSRGENLVCVSVMSLCSCLTAGM